MNAKDWLAANCDGSGPHGYQAETRTYPLGGGGNLILCLACAARENRYRYERGRETGAPDNWPQVDYQQCDVYATQEAA